MADFKLDGRMKVKTLKANFKKEFGASLRVYTTVTCKTPADDEKTLAALRAEGYKGGELVVGGLPFAPIQRSPPMSTRRRHASVSSFAGCVQTPPLSVTSP